MAAIALSLLLIPRLAEVGAAWALAGGTLAGLVACVVISERLTPIPIPWRDIIVSVVISAVTGLVAHAASAILGDCSAILRLMAGAAAGGLVFLIFNWLVHPQETRHLLGKLRSRLENR